jgi:hypothetical protein
MASVNMRAKWNGLRPATEGARAEIRLATRHDSPKDFPNGLTTIARVAARYQTVTETQSPAAAENKISQSREK